MEALPDRILWALRRTSLLSGVDRGYLTTTLQPTKWPRIQAGLLDLVAKGQIETAPGGLYRLPIGTLDQPKIFKVYAFVARSRRASVGQIHRSGVSPTEQDVRYYLQMLTQTGKLQRGVDRYYRVGDRFDPLPYASVAPTRVSTNAGGNIAPGVLADPHLEPPPGLENDPIAVKLSAANVEPMYLRRARQEWDQVVVGCKKVGERYGEAIGQVSTWLPYRICKHLAESGPATLNELAKALKSAHGGVKKRLQVLQTRGVVTKTPDGAYHLA